MVHDDDDEWLIMVILMMVNDGYIGIPSGKRLQFAIENSP